jgi:ketol-acid reductoisomerase
MALKIYYEKDAPIDALKGKKVAVMGYGSQGHAHSLNLRDSGIEVAVAELEGTDNYKLAVEHGFAPGDIKTAMDGATLIIVTVPDEIQAKVYKEQIAPNLVAGQTLGFCHGFNIHFKYIAPPIPFAQARAIALASPVASCSTATRFGTPPPLTNSLRTKCPGPFGAIITTLTSLGGTIYLK